MFFIIRLLYCESCVSEDALNIVSHIWAKVQENLQDIVKQEHSLVLTDKDSFQLSPGMRKPEPRHEKTCFLHMRKQRRRSASR